MPQVRKSPNIQVIATGHRGVVVGTAPDGFVMVILEGMDGVTEFPPAELTEAA